MNVEIKKADKKNMEVINFLVEENLKLYYQIHPEWLPIWNGPHHDYIEKTFKEQLIEAMTPKPIIYAAYIGDNVIGSGFVDETGYLNSLFVKEEYRNQLIGTKLLEKLIYDCWRFQVIKVDARIEAISLYKRFAFQETGEQKRNTVSMIRERNYYEK